MEVSDIIIVLEKKTVDKMIIGASAVIGSAVSIASYFMGRNRVRKEFKTKTGIDITDESIRVLESDEAYVQIKSEEYDHHGSGIPIEDDYDYKIISIKKKD